MAQITRAHRLLEFCCAPGQPLQSLRGRLDSMISTCDGVTQSLTCAAVFDLEITLVLHDNDEKNSKWVPIRLTKDRYPRHACCQSASLLRTDFRGLVPLQAKSGH